MKVLDRKSAIARMDNDEGIFLEILAIFLDKMPQDLKEIEIWAANNNIKSARKMAHKIKGASLNIGAEKMSFIADKIENIRSDSSSEWQDCISELKKEFDAFKSYASGEFKQNEERK